MKQRSLIILLVLALALLSACGGTAPSGAAETAPAATEAPKQSTVRVIGDDADLPASTPAPEAAAQPEKAAEPAATEAPAEAPAAAEPETPMQIAETLIGETTEALYAAIGYPESSDYAKSCLGDGDDGNLYYDGFTVYTYREGKTETVRYVE